MEDTSYQVIIEPTDCKEVIRQLVYMRGDKIYRLHVERGQKLQVEKLPKNEYIVDDTFDETFPLYRSMVRTDQIGKDGVLVSVRDMVLSSIDPLITCEAITDESKQKLLAHLA